jgi:hypothetical protein
VICCLNEGHRFDEASNKSFDDKISKSLKDTR